MTTIDIIMVLFSLIAFTCILFMFGVAADFPICCKNSKYCRMGVCSRGITYFGRAGRSIRKTRRILMQKHADSVRAECTVARMSARRTSERYSGALKSMGDR